MPPGGVGHRIGLRGRRGEILVEAVRVRRPEPQQLAPRSAACRASAAARRRRRPAPLRRRRPRRRGPARSPTSAGPSQAIARRGLRRPFRKPRRAAEDQPLARARHRDVDDPLLLGEGGDRALRAQLGVGERVDAPGARPSAGAARRDRDRRAAAARGSRAGAPRSARQTTGNSRPFALWIVISRIAPVPAAGGGASVSRDRPDAPGGERLREAAQVTALARLELAREPLELADVGDPPLRRVQRAEVEVVAELGDGARDDLAEAAVGGGPRAPARSASAKAAERASGGSRLEHVPDRAFRARARAARARPARRASSRRAAMRARCRARARRAGWPAPARRRRGRGSPAAAKNPPPAVASVAWPRSASAAS